MLLELKKKQQTHGVEAIFIPVSANHAAAKDGDFGKYFFKSKRNTALKG